MKYLKLYLLSLLFLIAVLLILKTEKSQSQKICNNCQFKIQNEIYEGVDSNNCQVCVIEKHKFRALLNVVVSKMLASETLDKSQMLFTLRLANTIYTSEENYLYALLIEFPKIYNFIDKFKTKYYKYIKCNNAHYLAKSGGVNFPYLRIQYQGMPASISYYFIKIDNKYTPCLANRFVFFKTMCKLKKTEKRRGGKGEINLLESSE